MPRLIAACAWSGRDSHAAVRALTHADERAYAVAQIAGCGPVACPQSSETAERSFDGHLNSVGHPECVDRTPPRDLPAHPLRGAVVIVEQGIQVPPWDGGGSLSSLLRSVCLLIRRGCSAHSRATIGVRLSAASEPAPNSFVVSNGTVAMSRSASTSVRASVRVSAPAWSRFASSHGRARRDPPEHPPAAWSASFTSARSQLFKARRVCT